MADKTTPIDTSTPLGTADPKQGDDRIRETKAALIELWQVDHYTGATSPYSEDAAGEHLQATLHARTSPVSVEATKGVVRPSARLASPGWSGARRSRRNFASGPHAATQRRESRLCPMKMAPAVERTESAAASSPSSSTRMTGRARELDAPSTDSSSCAPLKV